jgi:hypothetical protein
MGRAERAPEDQILRSPGSPAVGCGMIKTVKTSSIPGQRSNTGKKKPAKGIRHRRPPRTPTAPC